jgi:hypothetical protein
MAQLSQRRPGVLEAMEQIGRHLRWHGAMALEYFSCQDSGAFQILECNPRIGETVNALVSGVNLCEQLVRVSLDEPLAAPPPWQEGVCTHQGFLILAARALQGASRRHLVGELLQAIFRRGLYRSSQDELTRPWADWLSVFPFLGVTSLLLARPKAAQWLVSKTVANYSLHLDAAKRIRNLSAARYS